MTPELLEACAKRAYEIFAATSGETAPWAAVREKHKWHDAVTAHHQQPAAVARSIAPTLQERCVAQAYSELYKPAAEQPLVVPPIVAEASTPIVDPAPDGKKAKGK